jgi:hypothetical protein
MEQMTKCLVATIEKTDAKTDAYQVKMDADLKEMKADQEHLKETVTASQELLKEEMLAKIDGQDGLPARENGGRCGCL